MESGLSGRRALVTGGASGIGRAVALALAAEGADVAVADRRDPSDAVKAASAYRDRACGIVADVSQEADVVRMVATAADAFGGLDLYVNNAAGAWHEPLAQLTREACERTMATNVAASVFACREVAWLFINQRCGGATVAIGSTATVSAQPRETAYRASKAALKAHIEVAAVELAPFDIRVNLVTPGASDTEFVADTDAAQRVRVTAEIPLRREAAPEEIASAVIFLLSDRLAGYVTGTELIVDGGLHLRPMFHGGDAVLRALSAPERAAP
jgi:NAD(P)-dependent dehydrogenase (short-subunit alcohol dehydrogenase family)